MLMRFFSLAIVALLTGCASAPPLQLNAARVQQEVPPMTFEVSMPGAAPVTWKARSDLFLGGRGTPQRLSIILADYRDDYAQLEVRVVPAPTQEMLDMVTLADKNGEQFQLAVPPGESLYICPVRAGGECRPKDASGKERFAIRRLS